MGCPDYAILTENLTFTIQSYDNTGAPVDTDALPTFSVYEDETGTAIITGTMAKLNDAGTTGFYSEQLAITAANGYERYKTYTIRISAAVGSVSVAKTFAFICLRGSDVVTGTSGALTSTSNFKDYIGETGSGNDTLISALINRATKEIQNYAQRVFISATYRQFYNGDMDNEIILKEYPVTDIDYVSTSRNDVMYVVNTSSDAHRAGVSVEDSTLAAPTMTLEVYGGTNNGSNSITLSDHGTITLLVAAINALGSGWSATVGASGYANYDPVELIPAGNLHCLTNNAYLQAPAEPAAKFKCDWDTGIITLNQNVSRGTRNIVVKYTAGWSTIPADLEQICIDVVKVFYNARGKDSSVESKKLGDFAYKLFSGGGLSLSIEIKKRLDVYRRYSSYAF